MEARNSCPKTVLKHKTTTLQTHVRNILDTPFKIECEETLSGEYQEVKGGFRPRNGMAQDAG
jgi:hypothetical protein